ncbi:hypothetical protein FRC02_001103 [Tulasnella sp. 418]|nr:hypothetical protein FRC02_001103 [Tulasnella sp. 418]
MSALMAKGHAYRLNDEQQQRNTEDRSRLVVFRALNAINGGSEFSGPQVMSYLMGWGDKKTSHHHIPIYWNAVLHELTQANPDLQATTGNSSRKWKR